MSKNSISAFKGKSAEHEEVTANRDKEIGTLNIKAIRLYLIIANAILKPAYFKPYRLLTDRDEMNRLGYVVVRFLPEIDQLTM